MELHSYAKRRTTKKWTYEQKRKLVEARIKHDAIFNNEPRNSVIPWKKILALAKLDDFNVFFVRKQWSNMVAKYKQYKQNRLGNIPTRAIDSEMIQKITQEWEYFQPIHHFMTRKTTNLHSYALTRQDPQTDVKRHQLSVEQDNQASTSSMEHANASSDTNDDFSNKTVTEFQQVETDREFYWHHPDGNIEDDTTMGYNSNEVDDKGNNATGMKSTLSYFADASEDTQESLVIKSIPIANSQEAKLRDEECIEIIKSEIPNTDLSIKFEESSSSMAAHHTKQKITADSNLPQTNTAASEGYRKIPDGNAGGIVILDGSEGSKSNTKNVQLKDAIDQQVPTQHATPTKHLSERDKYYRHKRRFNRRLERRFDSILNVFGQIIRAEYPSINVTPLLGAAAATTSVMNTLFSSESEQNDSDSSYDNNSGDCNEMNAPVAVEIADENQTNSQHEGH